MAFGTVKKLMANKIESVDSSVCKRDTLSAVAIFLMMYVVCLPFNPALSLSVGVPLKLSDIFGCLALLAFVSATKN